jgi:hypothetical protein
MVRHLAQRVTLGILLIVLIGCSEDVQAPDSPVTAALKLASHRFLSVGASTTLNGLGTVIEVASLSGDGVLQHDPEANVVSCAKGGTGFVRARYREDASKNQIQTLGIVCINEVDSCVGHPRASFDLETFLVGGVAGNADLLAQGDQTLYAVCKAGGRLRLQQPSQQFPPLMFRIVDALGDGPYSLADDEFGLLRNGTVITFSGDTLTPPWLATVSRQVTSIVINGDGTVDINDEDCDVAPTCTYSPDFVRSGDVLIVGFGASDAGLESALASAGDAVLDSFVTARLSISWTDTNWMTMIEARRQVVYRLISLEIMDQLLRRFDGLYGLRQKGVRIAYWPAWQTRYLATHYCYPDEAAACQTVEDEIAALEASRIGGWIGEGYDLWFADFLGFEADGTYRPTSLAAPHFSNFNGLVMVVDAGPGLNPGVDKATTLATAVAGLAAEIGGKPVVLAVHWGPMTFFSTGEFCEAQICPSDFSNYFSLLEPTVRAMTTSFAPGQVKGFALPMFDGAHFDIRAPQEQSGGIDLNRVGETGYNNPLLNLYATQ